MRLMKGKVLVVVGLLLTPAILFAWTGPSSSPPSGNVAAPVNVGTTEQVKDGNLGVNGLAVFGNSLLQAASYLNWGPTAGSGGYGIRDNAGTLEFKNSGGAWSSLQATIYGLGGGSKWTSTGNDIYYNEGDVGIGTSDPTHAFEVVGPAGGTPGRIAGFYGAASNGDAEINIGGSGNYLDSSVIGYNNVDHYGYFSVFGLGNDRIVMDNAGEVGIGTTAPGAKLHVVGGSGADTEMRIESPDSSKAAFLRVRTTGGQGEFAYGGPSYGYWGGANSLNIINANGYGPITLNHFLNGGPIEHMRLDTSGNVAIGTSAMANYIGWPGSLNVNGQVRAARFYDDDANYYADLNAGANVGGAWTFRGPVYLAYEEYNDGEWYLCHHGGRVVLGHFCSASDERLKANLRPIEGVLEKLDNYRTVTFDWKDPGRGTDRQIGVIAQDFENDYPELVSADKETGYLYFDYQRLSAVLLEGEKELKARVDAQQQEIDELRKEIKALKEG